MHRAYADLPLAVQIHLWAALAALVLGPMILWRRKGIPWHRSVGKLWVALMLVTAFSSLFIRDFRMANIAGYTPIHLFFPFTLISLAAGLRSIRQGKVQRHQKLMQGLYLGACVVAGAFTLWPGRFLGQLVWSQWLGWM